jgi:FkbM family methyltransferase
MLKNRRQKNLISSSVIKFIEEIFRSSPYGYGISRYLAGRFFYRFFGEGDFKFFNKIIFKNNEVFVDVGANDGISALTFRLFNKFNKIVSFEPDNKHKTSLDRIKKKMDNYEYYLIGLGDKNEIRKLYVPSCSGVYIGQLASYIYEEAKNNVKAIITKKNIDKDVKIIEKEVETKTLDSFNLKPRVIKIDVEGYEYQVVKGSIKTIKQYMPILMIEVNDSSIIQVQDLLCRLNYKPFLYSKENDLLEEFILSKVNNNFVINLFFLSNEDQEKYKNNNLIK